MPTSTPKTAISAAAIFIVCMTLGVTRIAAADTISLRIGTGTSAGTYFPIGSVIAECITTSKLPYAGISNIMAIAQRAGGSASNVDDVSNGFLEAGLAQANVVQWAYNGDGPFADDKPRKNIRAIATLYLESLHFVVRTGTNISSIADLKGYRVSLDEQGSGTRLDSLSLLNEFEIDIDEVDAVYLSTADAIDRMRNNELDAFFVIAGYPINRIDRLIANGHAQVIPLSGPRIDQIVTDHPLFSADIIPAGTYDNTASIKTIGVPAQFIVNSDLDEELAYYLTQTLWSAETLGRLKKGHLKGNDVQLGTALLGINIPLHPGAEKFYREKGLLYAD